MYKRPARRRYSSDEDSSSSEDGKTISQVKSSVDNHAQLQHNKTDITVGNNDKSSTKNPQSQMPQEQVLQTSSLTSETDQVSVAPSTSAVSVVSETSGVTISRKDKKEKKGNKEKKEKKERKEKKEKKDKKDKRKDEKAILADDICDKPDSTNSCITTDKPSFSPRKPVGLEDDEANESIVNNHNDQSLPDQVEVPLLKVPVQQETAAATPTTVASPVEKVAGWDGKFRWDYYPELWNSIGEQIPAEDSIEDERGFIYIGQDEWIVQQFETVCKNWFSDYDGRRLLSSSEKVKCEESSLAGFENEPNSLQIDRETAQEKRDANHAVPNSDDSAYSLPDVGGASSSPRQIPPETDVLQPIFSTDSPKNKDSVVNSVEKKPKSTVAAPYGTPYSNGTDGLLVPGAGARTPPLLTGSALFQNCDQASSINPSDLQLLASFPHATNSDVAAGDVLNRMRPSSRKFAEDFLNNVKNSGYSLSEYFAELKATPEFKMLLLGGEIGIDSASNVGFPVANVNGIKNACVTISQNNVATEAKALSVGSAVGNVPTGSEVACSKSAVSERSNVYANVNTNVLARGTTGTTNSIDDNTNRGNANDMNGTKATGVADHIESNIDTSDKNQTIAQHFSGNEKINAYDTVTPVSGMREDPNAPLANSSSIAASNKYNLKYSDPTGRSYYGNTSSVQKNPGFESLTPGVNSYSRPDYGPASSVVSTSYHSTHGNVGNQAGGSTSNNQSSAFSSARNLNWGTSTSNNYSFANDSNAHNNTTGTATYNRNATFGEQPNPNQVNTNEGAFDSAKHSHVEAPDMPVPTVDEHTKWPFMSYEWFFVNLCNCGGVMPETMLRHYIQTRSSDEFNVHHAVPLDDKLMLCEKRDTAEFKVTGHYIDPRQMKSAKATEQKKWAQRSACAYFLATYKVDPHKYGGNMYTGPRSINTFTPHQTPHSILQLGREAANDKNEVKKLLDAYGYWMNMIERTPNKPAIQWVKEDMSTETPEERMRKNEEYSMWQRLKLEQQQQRGSNYAGCIKIIGGTLYCTICDTHPGKKIVDIGGTHDHAVRFIASHFDGKEHRAAASKIIENMMCCSSDPWRFRANPYCFSALYSKYIGARQDERLTNWQCTICDNQEFNYSTFQTHIQGKDHNHKLARKWEDYAEWKGV